MQAVGDGWQEGSVAHVVVVILFAAASNMLGCYRDASRKGFKCLAAFGEMKPIGAWTTRDDESVSRTCPRLKVSTGKQCSRPVPGLVTLALHLDLLPVCST